MRKKIIFSIMILSLSSMCLTGCKEKQDLTPTFEALIETQSEDEFSVNVAIEVESVASTTSSTESTSNYNNSSSFNQNISDKLAVPAEQELSEEDAVFLDSLIYSSLSDEEIVSVIESENNFKSSSDKESLIHSTLQIRNDLGLSEEFMMETIDYSNDEEMQLLIEQAANQLEEDMKKEPIDLSQYK